MADTATATATKGPSSFRPDIEGLRAVAVGLVVLDHVFGAPTGGFVGVDVFFVISGFLITGLLLREHKTSGTISFGRFYSRRARRILPAAVLVLLVTTIASQLVYFGARSTQVLWDGIASLLFVQNWHLIRSGTDYFAADGASSPLQHFWSLSVEEQFYVVWPWAIIAILAFATRRGHGGRRTMTVTVAALVALSFGWSVVESHAKPGWSYFSIESRAWELGVGALLAIAAPWLSRLPDRIRPWMSWGGLAAIAGSAILITSATPFPGPWAAIPVVGTGLVLLAGTNGTGRWMLPLTNPVARYLGRISFSIYLWHYPVVIIATSIYPHSSLIVGFASLAATLLFSAASYALVERPFRRLGTHRPSKLSAPSRRRGRKVLAAAGGALLVVLCLVQMKGPDWVIAGAIAPATPVRASATVPSGTALAAQVSRAAAARAWPSLTPSLDSVNSLDSAAQAYQRDDCLNDPVGLTRKQLVLDATQCSYGPASATKTAVVLGDSIATSWMPAVVGALVPQGWRVVGIGLESCPATEVTVSERLGRAVFADQCNSARSAALAYASSLAPRLVLVSNALGSIDRLVSGATGREAETEWESGTLTALRDLGRSGTRVDVLESPPESTAVADCATRVSSPATCLAKPGPDWFAKRGAERAAVREASADGVRASFIATEQWFCTSNNRCPAFVGDTLVKVDTGHLTTAYATRLTGVLKAALER